MTTEQRASATDTGLTALKKHLGEMQAKAMHIEQLLTVVEHLEAEGACEGARWSVTTQAHRLASEINVGLDSTALPEAVK